MPSGYKDSANVLAHRIADDSMVNLNMTNLSLYSSGAFSNVYRGVAEDTRTHASRDVAIKKTWKKHSHDHQAETRSIPEIDILRLLNRLNHKNIVQLLYDFANGYSDKTCYSLVFEFLPETLYSYMKQRKRHLEMIDIKLFTWQLFRGQCHLMKAKIMHRDIKPQNLLVDPVNGLLKISDFGSSATATEHVRQPCYHVTRYYRPPELLLESKMYGCEVDIWSCGCVFGEMLAGKTLLPGRSADNQLDLVIECFGLPNRDQAAAMHCPVRTFDLVNNKGYTIRKNYPRLFMLIPDHIPKPAVRLLERILVYTPKSRLYGMELLMDSFFSELFDPKTRRDGKPLCIGREDLEHVREGDGCITAESCSVD